jgi:anti-sigma factor RsiW
MLRCHEVTRLYATDEIRGAPLRTRLAVRLHLMMCRHCDRYVRELAAIGDAVRRAFRDVPAELAKLDALARRTLPGAGEPER